MEQERIDRMNILICTPGRLLQHMDQTASFNCDNLQILGKTEFFFSFRSVPIDYRHVACRTYFCIFDFIFLIKFWMRQTVSSIWVSRKRLMQ